MPRRRRFVVRGGRRGEEEKWISYADLLSAVLLIFALFIILILLNQKFDDPEPDDLIVVAQEQRIAELEQTVAATRKGIEDTVAVKTELVQELTEEFQDSAQGLEVDPLTGAIRLPGSVLFGTDSSVVTPAGRAYLEKFIPQYIAILMADPFRENIEQVIVEGHTDQDGDYLYNLELSQSRAFSVVETILSDTFPSVSHREQLQTIITANGRSFAIPIVNSDGSANPEESRRVEFKFRMKDGKLLEQLQKIMEESELPVVTEN